MTIIPKLINVQLSYDDRGECIVTNLIFKKKIKRFYQIENHKINFVRIGTGTNMKIYSNFTRIVKIMCSQDR